MNQFPILCMKKVVEGNESISDLIAKVEMEKYHNEIYLAILTKY